MTKKTCQSPEIKEIIAKARILSEKANSKPESTQEPVVQENVQKEEVPLQEVESKKIPVVQNETPSTGLQQYINFKGVMFGSDGSLTKTKYLDRLKLSEDQYGHLQLTEEQAMRVSRTMRHLSTGVNAAVPIACTGPECPFSRSCPYEKEGRAPIGLDCIVETQLINYWTEQYFQEFNVDPSCLTELHLVSELAEFNIYEMRITKYIAANHPDLMQTVLSGFSESGDAVENVEVARAFDLKERIKRNRMKVLEALSATRKERLKLAVKESTPTSLANTMAEVRRKFDELKNDMEKMKAVDGEVLKG